jgi:hypothetical protein
MSEHLRYDQHDSWEVVGMERCADKKHAGSRKVLPSPLTSRVCTGVVHAADRAASAGGVIVDLSDSVALRSEPTANVALKPGSRGRSQVVMPVRGGLE